MISRHKSTKLNSFNLLLCITNNSIKHQSFVYTLLNDQAVHLLRNNGPGSDGNEGVLCIPKSYNITGTSLSDYLSYQGYSLGGGGSYPSAEMQLVYSTASADWAAYYIVLIYIVIY